jgi:hypothetical protein
LAGNPDALAEGLAALACGRTHVHAVASDRPTGDMMKV